ncbi:MAG: hypothetical protein AB4368_13125, partial [Xenococcaceae cyanobacterium]
YIPTEQVRGKPRLNSDIYAIGMIGIQALTGIHPLHLQEDADGEVIWQNRAEVNDRLAAILTKMVRYHFKERYQYATEVLHALEPLANYYTLIQSTSATRQTSPEVAVEPELRETKVSLEVDPPDAQAVPEPKLQEKKVVLDLKQPTPEVAVEPELRETKVSLEGDLPDAQAVPEPELRETKVALDLKQPTPKVAVEPELRETKVSLGVDPWNLEAVPEPELRETKVAPDLKQPTPEVAVKLELWETKVSLEGDPPNTEAVPEPELRETKVALDLKQPTPEVAVEPELRETKVSLGVEHSDGQAVSEPKLQDKKVALKPGKLTSELALEKQKKSNLVSSPADSLAPSKDLELNQANIFVRLNKYRLLIGAGIVSVLVSIVAGYTYMTHRHSYLQAQGALEQIEELKIAEKYQECVQKARTFPKDYSDLQAEVKTLLNECEQLQAEVQLTEAQKLAEQSRFKDAIALAAQISTDTDIYSEAQQLMSQWSEKIFQVSSNKYQEGNLKEALAIAGAIPKNSPLAKKVQAKIKQWDKEWQQNQTHLQTAQKALDERRWQDAIDTAKKVSNTDYWQKQSEPIIQKAEAGMSAAQAAASRKTYSAPRKTYTPPPSPPKNYTPPPSSSTPKSFPKREPIPSTAPFPIHRSSSTSDRSSSTDDWTCLNNPNPKCHK